MDHALRRVEITDVVLDSLLYAPPLPTQGFNDKIQREDILRQGRGEALGVMSCCVLLAVGESRPLPSRTPIGSSFVAMVGVFVARCDPCQVGRTMSKEMVTITVFLFWN